MGKRFHQVAISSSPSSLNSVEEVMKVAHTAETAKTCGGSADADFVALCEGRGRAIKSTAGNNIGIC